MKCELKRVHYTSSGIFSKLTVGDEHVFFTLEHGYPNKDWGYSAKVPKGEYTCKRGTHQLDFKKPFETFEIKDVPGHTGILIHPGNFQSDSEGCVLIGKEMVLDYPARVIASRAAFKEFMDLQSDCYQFILIVS